MSPSPDSFHSLPLLSLFSLFQSTLLCGHSSPVKRGSKKKKANETEGQARFIPVSTFIISSLSSPPPAPLPLFLLCLPPFLSLSLILEKLTDNSLVDIKN